MIVMATLKERTLICPVRWQSNTFSNQLSVRSRHRGTFTVVGLAACRIEVEFHLIRQVVWSRPPPPPPQKKGQKWPGGGPKVSPYSFAEVNPMNSSLGRKLFRL